MKLNKLMKVILPALLTVSLTSQACTTLAITDTDGDVFHGRTLEYMEDIPSWLTYYPVGMTFQATAPDGSNSVSYQAKYAILAVTTPISDNNEHDIVEGMNSGGLSFTENMMMDMQLTPPEKAAYKEAIPVTSLGEWALARFATVEEVKQAINQGHFWSPIVSRYGKLPSPFHYAFYDKKGGSIVVETVNGKLHVYDNPTQVMTNGPAFPWHLTNLNNYTHLTNEDRSFGKLGNISLMQPDSGVAVTDLPSSDTSVGRFVRGVYYTSYAEKASSGKQAINTLAHIMSRFDRPKNITTDTFGAEGEGSGNVNGNGKPVTEYTVWTTLSDLSNGQMYVRGYNDINYQQFSLQQYAAEKAPVYVKINVAKP